MASKQALYKAKSMLLIDSVEDVELHMFLGYVNKLESMLSDVDPKWKDRIEWDD